MVDVKAAAAAAGVSQCAIRMRMCRNRKRGEADLLKADLRGGHYKMTEAQAIRFWHLVAHEGMTTEKACKLVGITKSQGDNIRSGKTWNRITGKVKVVYGDY